MKTIRLLLATAAFTLTGLTCDAKPMPVNLPDDFVSFYQNFRVATKTQNNENLLPLMCFPFRSRELSELIGERTKKYSANTFKKYPTLANSYLIDGMGEVHTPIELPSTGKIIYTNAQDFIEKNADPRHPENIDESFSRDFSYEMGQAKISNLLFEKKQRQWCWSGASYFGDPLDDIKNPRKIQR